MSKHTPSVIIIGNGPAGVSASIYTIRAGIPTTVIGNGQGALGKADKIENYYGFEEPLSGPELLNRGLAQAKRLGVKFVEDEVLSVSAENGFTIKTKDSEYHAQALILSTGNSRIAPPILGLSELEGKGVSYCAVCDGFFYKGKDIAVLGNGEYALHEVEELLPIAGSVTLLTNGEKPKVSFPEQVKVVTDKISTLIRGPFNPLFGTPGPLEGVKFENDVELRFSGIFVAYGVAGSAALAKKIGATTDGNYIVVDKGMGTNINGLFAAGDCTGGLLQIAKAVGEGAIAGTSAIKYLRAL